MEFDKNFIFCVLASAGLDEAYRIRGLFPAHWNHKSKIRVDELTIVDHRIIARIGDEIYEFTAVQTLYDRPLAAHSAVNGAVTLARLGCNVTLVCAVGKDARGTLLKDQMRERQINCKFLHREATPYSFVLIDDQNRKVVLIRKDVYIVDESEARKKCKDLSPSQIYLMGLHSFEIRLAEIVGKNAEKFDFLIPSRDFYSQKDNPDIQAFLKRVNTLQINRSEAGEMFNIPQTKKQLRAMHALGPETALITFAHKGAVVSEGNKMTYQRPIAVRKEVDPTGCGDTFGPTFSFARLSFPLKDSLQAGAWAASQCAEHWGANGGTPIYREFINYMHQLQYPQGVAIQPAEILT